MNIKSFHKISFIFFFIALLEAIFITLVYFDKIDFQLTSSDYFESVTNIILGGSIAYGLYYIKIWGFVSAVIVIPLSCIYSIYDAATTNNNDLILLYGAGIFSFYGYILLILIRESQSIFYIYNWIRRINKELLFLPKLMFCISLYFIVDFFFDNLIAIFIAILFFITFKIKQKPMGSKPI